MFAACTKSIQELFTEGDQLQNKKAYLEAAAVYTSLIKRKNNLQKAYFERGICYLHLKKYAFAIEDFNTIISLRMGPNFEFSLNEDTPFAPEEAHYQITNIQAYKNRGIAYFFSDSLNKAFLDMDNAIKNNFELTNSMIWQGNIAYKMGNTKYACTLFKKARELNDTAANEFLQKYCSQ